jgi:CheY-like chemotaxis protein
MAKLCILQVEDEDSDVLLLRYAFQRVGINQLVQVVTRGQEAVDYLSGVGAYADREAYPLPDLVLLDLKLPDKDGLEVLEWIRRQARLKTTVVIALTSSNYEEDILRAYELGANSYVVKAADQEKRLEFARHLKGWWLGCNEYPRLEWSDDALKC